MNEKTLFKISYGLYVLSTRLGDEDNGCIINTAILAASKPNHISICVNKLNHTHDMIMESKEFTVSILSEKATFDVFERFGFHSGKDINKFENYGFCKRSNNDIYYITEGTNGYISAKVDKIIDLGSHTMFIGEISDMELLNDEPSLTYDYYHKHIKPKPEEKKNTNETIWRCTICGYEYKGEELPEDFICPICKHPASDFIKVEEEEI